MGELRVSNLLAGALAAVTGAVVASFFGVGGTLAGAGITSILTAVVTVGYAHSLKSAYGWMRRRLLRRAGGAADPPEPHAQSIRWQQVTVTAVAVFAIAIGAITMIESAAGRPLASLLGHHPQRGARTSVGVVVSRAGGSAAPARHAPATSATATTAPRASAPTTAPGGVATTKAPAARTAPSTAAPSTTTPMTTTPPATRAQAPTTR
jgi:hypothetical protein